MDNISLMDQMRQAPALRQLPLGELDRLLSRSQLRRFGPGEVLTEEGCPGDVVFLIVEGRVAVRMRISKREQAVIGTRGSGDWVGEMALLRPAPRTATAETATVASLLELKKSDLDKVMERFPQVKEALEGAYQERLAALRGQSGAQHSPGMNGGPGDD